MSRLGARGCDLYPASLYGLMMALTGGHERSGRPPRKNLFWGLVPRYQNGPSAFSTFDNVMHNRPELRHHVHITSLV